MKIIKLSCSNDATHLEKQTPGYSACWGDCKFYINQDIEECDAWVVFGNLLKYEESVICSKENIIFVAGEPSAIWLYDKKFLKQFSKIITCQREIKGSDVIYGLQGHPWHVGLNHSNPNDLGWSKSYDELLNIKNIPKTKLLSIITSNKKSTVGHRKRYEFALALKEALGDKADLFGRGINDFSDKWDVLEPYKYSIAIENCATDDYVSEKLNDCFLAHTFPFYYGAPNVSDYFSSDSFEMIDINDLEGSIKKIKSVMENQMHYENHLKAVLDSKDKCLNKYNIFPMIVDMINNYPNKKEKEEVVIKIKQAWLKNYIKIVVDKIKTSL